MKRRAANKRALAEGLLGLLPPRTGAGSKTRLDTSRLFNAANDLVSKEERHEVQEGKRIAKLYNSRIKDPEDIDDLFG